MEGDEEKGATDNLGRFEQVSVRYLLLTLRGKYRSELLSSRTQCWVFSMPFFFLSCILWSRTSHTATIWNSWVVSNGEASCARVPNVTNKLSWRAPLHVHTDQCHVDWGPRTYSVRWALLVRRHDRSGYLIRKEWSCWAKSVVVCLVVPWRCLMNRPLVDTWVQESGNLE